MQIRNLFTLSSNPLLAFALAAAAALLTGYAAQWLGRRILFRVVRRFTVAEALVRCTAAPMQIVMPLLFLQVLLLAAPDAWTFMPGVRHTVGLIFIVGLTWLLVRAISGIADTVALLRPVTAADNLQARRVMTQTRVIARTLMGVVWLVGVALMLMTFPGVRSLGTSLLASAGLAGIVAGLAARPVLGNLIAGLQIALSQPLRLDDVVIVEGEWGRIEEITGSYVVVAIWDQRRLIVPLQYFIEHPFQNWTRNSAEIMGTVLLWVDYGLPLAPLRGELERICRGAPEWDGRVQVLQVTDASDRCMQLRALVSSADASRNFDLRCKVREQLIDFIRRNYPEHLPRTRAELAIGQPGAELAPDPVQRLAARPPSLEDRSARGARN